MKILWASRHPMTENQKEDLADWMKCVPRNELGQVDGLSFKIVSENLLWQATDNGALDHEAALTMWSKLFDEYDMLCGVFPPVSMRALFDYKNQHPELPSCSVLTPISKQDRKTRENGEFQIEFVHLRWEPLV